MGYTGIPSNNHWKICVIDGYRKNHAILGYPIPSQTHSVSCSFLHPLVGREGTYPISNPHQICQVGDGWSVAIHLQWPTADPLFAGTNGTYFLRGLDGGQDGWHPDFSSSKTTSFAAEQMSRCHQMSFITMVRDSWRVIHAIQCFSCRTLSEFANPHCPGRTCAIDRALGEANPHAFARHVHLPSEGMPQQPGNLPISVDCTRITRLKTEMLEVFECIWMYLIYGPRALRHFGSEWCEMTLRFDWAWCWFSLRG